MYIIISSINADCSVLCVQEKIRMLIVVCFVFKKKKGQNADCGVLCVQGKSGKRQ